ncbi:unnamed protein product, partial [Meganyctiphanes norvegica]
MSESFEEDEYAANFAQCFSFYNIANETKGIEVKHSNGNGFNQDVSHNNQDVLWKSANGSSEVKVKTESEVIEETIKIQSVEIKLTEIEIHEDPILGEILHCDKNVSKKCAIIKHPKTHTGNKPYTCSQCAKAYARKSDFINHQKTHTGEKTYQCCQCDKAFFHNVALRKHMRTHTGRKP